MIDTNLSNRKVNLQSIGYQNNIIITESGEVLDVDKGTKKNISATYRYIYIKEQGYTKGNLIGLFYLYRKAFNKELYIDNYQDLKGEVWQEIPQHKKYLISNYGRIKSYKRNIVRILNPRKFNGYLRVDLDGQDILLHRIIAEVFIPTDNKDNKVVHHKDFNKQNNSINNLQWLTREEHTKLHQEQRKKKQ